MYDILLGISSIIHLDFHFMSNFPRLTWSPPSFYSDDIPQRSITIYHVYVVDQDGSVIANINTTDTFYQLPSNLTVCDIYIASVKAFIEQYSSLVTTITEQYTGSKIISTIYLIYIIVTYYQIILLTFLTMK